jgi:hypothetical protein
VCLIDIIYSLLFIVLVVLYAAAMGATFAFTETFVANQRQKTDPLNGMAGGCAAGFLAGIRSTLNSCCVSKDTRFMLNLLTTARSLPMAVAGCAAIGAAVGGFDYSGQLASRSATPEKREERRKRFLKQPNSQ